MTSGEPFLGGEEVGFEGIEALSEQIDDILKAGHVIHGSSAENGTLVFRITDSTRRSSDESFLGYGEGNDLNEGIGNAMASYELRKKWGLPDLSIESGMAALHPELYPKPESQGFRPKHSLDHLTFAAGIKMYHDGDEVVIRAGDIDTTASSLEARGSTPQAAYSMMSNEYEKT